MLRHNNFWKNDDEHCYRCPHAFLKPLPAKPADAKEKSKENADGEGELNQAAPPPPTDAFSNLIADPVFFGSPSHRQHEAADPARDTPKHLIQDSTLAQLEKGSRKGFFGLKEKPKPTFKKRGQGPYVLSPYSPLLGKGIENLKNPEGGTGDIGLFGGPEGRMDKPPY
jgi:hypothetical protein